MLRNVLTASPRLFLLRPQFSYMRSAQKRKILRERAAFFNQRELKTAGLAFQTDTTDAASVVQATQAAHEKRASRTNVVKKLSQLKQLRDVLKANISLGVNQSEFATERFPVNIAENVIFARHKHLLEISVVAPIEPPALDGITLKEYCEARLSDTLEQLAIIGDPFGDDDVGSGLSMWNSRLGCFANVSSYPLTSRHMTGFGFLNEVPAAMKRKSVNFLNYLGIPRFRMQRFIDQTWRHRASITVQDPPADWIKPQHVKRIVDVFLSPHKPIPASFNLPPRVARTLRMPRADLSYRVKGHRKYPYVTTVGGMVHPAVARNTVPSMRKRKWAFLVYLDAIGKLIPNRVPYWFTSPFRVGKK